MFGSHYFDLPTKADMKFSFLSVCRPRFGCRSKCRPSLRHIIDRVAFADFCHRRYVHRYSS